MRLPNILHRKATIDRSDIGATEPCRVANVGELALAYNDEGSGEPVVCLHAVGHGARDFEAFRAGAKAKHRVIALDWPGHGRSSKDTSAPSVRHYAKVLEGFLDAIGVERATLVGNSIGGGAAIRFAAEFPGRVRALVLENPAGLEPNDIISQTAIAGMVRLFRAGAENAIWFGAAFDAYYRAILPSAPAHEQRARIVAAGSQRENAALIARAWESFSDPSQDLRGLGATISKPVLFAWAIKDKFVQLWRSRPAILEYPNARIEEFDAGHSPHLETPQAFLVAFEQFMNEVEAREKN